MDRLSLGKRSEGIAVEFLKKNRFKIIQRNFSCRVGELDIIAKDKNVFVFIEVRSTRGSLFHSPIDSLTPSKIMRIRVLAEIWLKKHGINNTPLRFDVVGIVHDDTDVEIKHLKDAF